MYRFKNPSALRADERLQQPFGSLQLVVVSLQLPKKKKKNTEIQNKTKYTHFFPRIPSRFATVFFTPPPGRAQKDHGRGGVLLPRVQVSRIMYILYLRSSGARG